MVRLIDGVITNPVIIIASWTLAFVLVAIILRVNSDIETQKLGQISTLGAYVFVLNTITIPIQLIFPFIPFPLTLSGVTLTLIILGVKRGLLISTAAMILNHIFIPGATSMLGLNLVNMAIASLAVGFFPSFIYNRMGRRIRYLSGFFAGLTYVVIEGILILLEFFVSHPEFSSNDIFLIVEGLVFWFVILGVIEGFFTAMTSSYYHRVSQQLYYPSTPKITPKTQIPPPVRDVRKVYYTRQRPKDPEFSLFDLRGSTVTLDPRSKIIITYLIIIGIAISIDFFQIFLYLLLFFPLMIFFKPRLIFLRRALNTIPFILLLSIILAIGLQTEIVRVNIFNYVREYTKWEFIGLIVYRYFVIMLYNFMLLHSEPSHTDIIEALASFRLGSAFVTLLLLVKQLSTRLTDDYRKMVQAAGAKGAFQSSFIKNAFVRLLILGRLGARTVEIGNTLSETLLARGFHIHFTPSTRPWTTEGVTLLCFSVILSLEITIIPWLRIL